MRHRWSILCSSSSIDQQSNQLSLFNIIEGLTLGTHEEVPNPVSFNLPINCHVVSFWTLESSEESYLGITKISLESPSGEVLINGEVPIDLTQTRGSRTRLFLNGLPFRGGGEYLFHIYIMETESDNWVEVETIPLHINMEPFEAPTED